MNITDLHQSYKAVSAINLFKGENGGAATALQITEDALLKEHTTHIPALLVCVLGEVVFENEKGVKEKMLPGDYIHIEPMVMHWVKGVKDSQLLLLK